MHYVRIRWLRSLVLLLQSAYTNSVFVRSTANGTCAQGFGTCVRVSGRCTRNQLSELRFGLAAADSQSCYKALVSSPNCAETDWRQCGDGASALQCQASIGRDCGYYRYDPVMSERMTRNVYKNTDVVLFLWPDTTCHSGSCRIMWYVGTNPTTDVEQNTWLWKQNIPRDSVFKRFDSGITSWTENCPHPTQAGQKVETVYTGIHGVRIMYVRHDIFQCVPCPQGTYSVQHMNSMFVDADCTPCQSFSTSQPRAPAVTSCLCNAGYEGEALPTTLPHQVFCSQCVANTWKSSVGNEKCTSCTGNRKSPTISTAASSCHCPAGTSGGDWDVCTPCLSDTYRTATGNPSCLTCPNGTASLAGSTELNDCKCRPGSTGPDGQALCIMCTPGTYKTLAGSSACISCPVAYSSVDLTADAQAVRPAQPAQCIEFATMPYV